MAYFRLKHFLLACVPCLTGATALLAPQPAHASSCAPYGLIGEQWDDLGGASGALGACVDNETSDGAGGRIEQFQDGYIDWISPESQAYACWGLIGEAWMSRYGGPVASGQPVENESTVPNQPTNAGAFCMFQTHSGEYSGAYSYLVWNPGRNGNSCSSHSDNVCSVYGAIGAAWYENLNEWENPGLPIDEVHTGDATHLRQDFQSMYITYNVNTGGTCLYLNDGQKWGPTWSGGAC